MKTINIGRGKGKTTRLLYASEMNQVPIITHSKQSAAVLKDMAKKLHLNIPEPISILEASASNKLQGLGHSCYIDESLMCLEAIMNSIGLSVEAVTLTAPYDADFSDSPSCEQKTVKLPPLVNEGFGIDTVSFG